MSGDLLEGDLLRRLNGNFFDGKLKDNNPTDVGKYTFSNGTLYHGKFKEGTFDGKGTLYFPKGGKFVATWKAGRLIKGTYFYEDNLKYEPVEWKYCTDSDRRFWTECQGGIRLGRCAYACV